jgi:hypothetical protein
MRRRALGNGVITLVCAAVVAAIVVTNAAPQPPPAVGWIQVTLNSLAGVSAENQHLRRIGARVRILPLESRCTASGSWRPKRRQRDPRHLRWIRSVSATQAPPGSTTIVLASEHGLGDATFQMHGRAPSCLAVIATVRSW